MPLACLVEVKAFPDNEFGKENRTNAFVKAYLIDSQLAQLPKALSEACEFMGFELLEICNVSEIKENEIPPEAIAFYKSQGFGFGSFYTYPEKQK